MVLLFRTRAAGASVIRNIQTGQCVLLAENTAALVVFIIVITYCVEVSMGRCLQSFLFSGVLQIIITEDYKGSLTQDISVN